MSISNYTELKSAISAFFHRDDIDAYADIFVTTAESILNTDLRSKYMEYRKVANVVDRLVNLPSDFIELRNIDFGERVPASFRSLEQLDINRNVGEVSYSISGDVLEFGSNIIDEIDVEIVYYGKIPSLVSNSTNKILTNYPELYLYGCLREAALFAQDDNRIEIWDDLFRNRIEAINDAESTARYSGSANETIGG